MQSHKLGTDTWPVADPDVTFGGGAQGAEVERRRREDRGAKGAEGDGGVPLSTGGGVFY